MSIYIVTLLILLLFSFFEMNFSLSEIHKKKMRFILFFILVFQTGFRWKTGTDWEPYLDHFKNLNGFSDVLYDSSLGFESGYGFFVLAVKKIFNSYSAFLVIHAIIYYWLIFSAIKKTSSFFFMSIMVFYAITFGILGSNRQLIAIAICLYSLRYIIDKKPLNFFVLIGIAYLFHTSALVFVIFYFINREIKKPIIFAILILSIVLGRTNMPGLIFSFIGSFLGGMSSVKVDLYTEDAQKFLTEYQLSIFGLFKRILFFLLFLANYNILKEKVKYYKLVFNAYFVGLVFYFLFSSTLIILVNRGSLYFNIMECFLLPAQFILIKKTKLENLALVILFVLLIFLIFQSINIYEDLFIPYKGIFINSDFDRSMH